MPRRSRSQPDPLATFPEWARRLAERYYTKTVSTFILHGAVRDLQPATTEDAGSPGVRAEAAGRSIGDAGSPGVRAEAAGRSIGDAGSPGVRAEAAGRSTGDGKGG